MIITVTLSFITCTTCLTLEGSEISPPNGQVSGIPSVSLNGSQIEVDQALVWPKNNEEQEGVEQEDEEEEEEEGEEGDRSEWDGGGEEKGKRVKSKLSDLQLFPLTFMHLHASTVPSVQVNSLQSQLSGMNSLLPFATSFKLLCPSFSTFAASFSLTLHRSSVPNRFYSK